MADEVKPALDGAGGAAIGTASADTDVKSLYAARDAAKAEAAKARAEAAETAAKSAQSEIARLQSQLAEASKRAAEFDTVKAERDRFNAQVEEAKKFAEAFVSSRKDQIPEETIKALTGIDPIRQMLIVNSLNTKATPPAAPPAVPPQGGPQGDAELATIAGLRGDALKKAIGNLDVKRRRELYEFIGGHKALTGR